MPAFDVQYAVFIWSVYGLTFSALMVLSLVTALKARRAKQTQATLTKALEKNQ